MEVSQCAHVENTYQAYRSSFEGQTFAITHDARFTAHHLKLESIRNSPFDGSLVASSIQLLTSSFQAPTSRLILIAGVGTEY